MASGSGKTRSPLRRGGFELHELESTAPDARLHLRSELFAVQADGREAIGDPI
jgi:hypothetical protein